MANETIGMVRCPLSGELAAVRKDRAGRLYYISIAGKIAPSSDFGQDWFLEHATLWGAGGTPPDACPEWIAQGKSFPPATRSRVRKPHNPPQRKQAAPEPRSTPARKDDTPPAAAPEPPAGGSAPPPAGSDRKPNPFSILDW